MVGANFIPSTAQNELTMFQVETYDPVTIDRELGYAESLGFNAVRVFLHNLLWESPEVFLDILESFLQLTEEHNIGVMFVLLDSCWNAYPKSGIQPEPIPYVHNSVYVSLNRSTITNFSCVSRWVQAPGIDIVEDSTKFKDLKPYITGVVSHFRNDPRVIAWYIFAIGFTASNVMSLGMSGTNRTTLAIPLILSHL